MVVSDVKRMLAFTLRARGHNIIATKDSEKQTVINTKHQGRSGGDELIIGNYKSVRQYFICRKY